MVAITLPDGSVRTYDDVVNGMQIAESIGKKLAKDAVAVRVDGDLKDLSTPITTPVQLEIITRTSEDGLEVLRHDAAHVFAEAIKELYPETQITIGPAVENGFYYDLATKTPLSTDDFEKIETRMREIVARDEPIHREEWSRADAIKLFREMGEHYKVEIIESIPGDDVITLYRQGNFIDLCRGPHLPSTGKLGTAFKLMKLAGAYWRGDSNNEMLQRVYGTAWASQDQLDHYLFQLEEAEKRDHRKIAKEMNLFHIQDEAPGSIFWHPKGWTLYSTLQAYVRKKMHKYNYGEVNTPIIVDRTLWEKSGHWENFHDNMFTIETADERHYAVKPMSCPCHIQIFKQGIKSYRDLPLRMAEFGCCHRNESSGSLHGLMRVRAMVQDDGHIFCTEDQILQEAKSFSQLLIEMYKELGFEEIQVKFADRPEVRAGSDEQWDKAEHSLREAALASGLDFSMNPGDGAFYGPKLEFHLKDAIGRTWQCGTLQLDFVLPQRLEAFYIDEAGEKKNPVMLHRAVLGSFERFTGILIESYAGKFPFWLAPLQVSVATITDDSHDYAMEVVAALKQAGIKAEADIRNEKISYKIRELSLQKVPVIFVVGKREMENRQVAIRTLGSQDQEILSLSAAIDKLLPMAQMPS
ncbi:MAG: threonine--tRNA ligase [Alphaproteobacteria bacterium]|nr:threonine--tRNA ligase [Alphaproteobacteria bacterium]